MHICQPVITSTLRLSVCAKKPKLQPGSKPVSESDGIKQNVRERFSAVTQLSTSQLSERLLPSDDRCPLLLDAQSREEDEVIRLQA